MQANNSGSMVESDAIDAGVYTGKNMILKANTNPGCNHYQFRHIIILQTMPLIDFFSKPSS